MCALLLECNAVILKQTLKHTGHCVSKTVLNTGHFNVCAVWNAEGNVFLAALQTWRCGWTFYPNYFPTNACSLPESLWLPSGPYPALMWSAFVVCGGAWFELRVRGGGVKNETNSKCSDTALLFQLSSNCRCRLSMHGQEVPQSEHHIWRYDNWANSIFWWS